jgi:hypothetical protein
MYSFTSVYLKKASGCQSLTCIMACLGVMLDRNWEDVFMGME